MGQDQTVKYIHRVSKDTRIVAGVMATHYKHIETNSGKGR